MSWYLNNGMNSSPTRPSPREFDDRKRGSSHSLYPEFYDLVDNMNGSPRSPNTNTGVAVEVPVSQPGQHPQQRLVPIEQRRPPVTNNAPLARGGGANGRARPPAYPGPPFEEVLHNKTEAAKQRQTQRRRGYRRGDDSGEDSDAAARPASDGRPGPTPSSRSESFSQSNNSPPITRDRPNPPPKSGPDSPESASPAGGAGCAINGGNGIPRLNSPSIMTSVLQPLDRKVHEYDARMHDAQGQMAQLDAEMAALQERRREAENRYMEAKSKHDEYRRQYQDVERALRGELDTFTRLSFDDEMRPSTQMTMPPPQTPQMVNSRTESYGSLNKKPKAGHRFRMSLFG